MSTPLNPPPASSRRRALVPLLLASVVVAVILGVVGWWLTRGDAPAEADLETATASLDDAAETETTDDAPAGDDDTTSSTSGDEAPTVVGIEGQWTVDTSVGEFSFQDSTGTFVGFRVAEELTTIGEIEAVGRTPVVSGTVTIVGDEVTAASIEADLASITTDDSRRDDRVRGALDTDQFPTATFELTSPIALGPGAVAGEPVAATAAGDLTIRDVTRPVEFDLQAQLVDGTIVIVGALDVVFEDYGVTVPSAPIVLSADDFGVVELQLFLARS